MLIYQQVSSSFNLGFAGALGVILLAVSLVVVIAYNHVLARFSGQEGLT
jgi:putative spermidine/putrescine transport system permease protein